MEENIEFSPHENTQLNIANIDANDAENTYSNGNNQMIGSSSNNLRSFNIRKNTY